MILLRAARTTLEDTCPDAPNTQKVLVTAVLLRRSDRISASALAVSSRVHQRARLATGSCCEWRRSGGFWRGRGPRAPETTREEPAAERRSHCGRCQPLTRARSRACACAHAVDSPLRVLSQFAESARAPTGARCRFRGTRVNHSDPSGTIHRLAQGLETGTGVSNTDTPLHLSHAPACGRSDALPWPQEGPWRHVPPDKTAAPASEHSPTWSWSSCGAPASTGQPPTTFSSARARPAQSTSTNAAATTHARECPVCILNNSSINLVQKVSCLCSKFGSRRLGQNPTGFRWAIGWPRS